MSTLLGLRLPSTGLNDHRVMIKQGLDLGENQKERHDSNCEQDRLRYRGRFGYWPCLDQGAAGTELQGYDG